mgnify:CR=1 FL=1
MINDQRDRDVLLPVFIEGYSLSIGGENMKIQSLDLIIVIVVEVRNELVQQQASNSLLSEVLAHSQ